MCVCMSSVGIMCESVWWMCGCGCEREKEIERVVRIRCMFGLY